MNNRVNYLKLLTLVRPENHSLEMAPFDATAFYDWSHDEEILEDLQDTIYDETSE